MISKDSEKVTVTSRCSCSLVLGVSMPVLGFLLLQPSVTRNKIFYQASILYLFSNDYREVEMAEIHNNQIQKPGEECHKTITAAKTVSFEAEDDEVSLIIYNL